MTNKEITLAFGIPQSTLSDWSKKIKTDWRYKIYTHLKELKHGKNK